MIKRLLAVITYISFVSIFSSYAQNKFSESPELFVKEMEIVFKGAGDNKAAKEFIETLDLFWISPDTDDQLKKLVIATCNKMAKKKARPYPDYHTYLTTIMSFKKHNHLGDSFNNWHKKVTELSQKPRLGLRHLHSFISTSKNLIENNAIYTTPAVKWYTRNNSYKYEYNNNKLSIVFAPSDIVCYAKKDSIVIYNTQGVFYPLEKMWYGKSGMITWERSGFERDMVYATFNEFQIKMDKAELNIDTVQFYNRHYFEYPIKGTLNHKVMKFKSPENTSYPKFTSSEQRFKINQIHPNINYEGGFAQFGAKFLGAGTNENPAIITISRNDTSFITAKSLYFALRKGQILSNNTEISIVLDKGHIYHPGLIFKYMADIDEVHIIRNGDGIALSPYFDTYHNISLDVELIRWKIGDRWMDLRMLTGASQNQAFFESLSYFRLDFYNQLQGMDAIHPLQGLRNCSKYFYGQPFTAFDYAKFIGYPESQIRQQIINLSFYGFIRYNVNTDEITIRQRLKDYLDFRLGKKDYDVIRFNSITNSEVANARIDLQTNDLDLNGVENISICDHQNVVFYPQNKKIILKENRNFVFNGTINAGMLTLTGNGFKFLYDDFRIDMSNIDSLKMSVETGEKDYFGQPLLRGVENIISQLSGYLQIDDPNNKSGSKHNPLFPVLNSTVESYVYFDSKDIQDGAYHKDEFYFTLDPFEMDSINTLKRPNFDFSGTFESNIFPTFRENLTIRPDFSLGFKRDTPEEGYSIYNNKATFTNSIDMSSQGLRGNGELKYLTSTSSSEDFTFLPNMVKGLAHSFTVDKGTEGTQLPDATAKYAYLEYMPHEEELSAQSQEENFTMYNNEAMMQGKIKVTPHGMTGEGTFFLHHANIKSKDFDFGDHTVLADSSDFNLTGAKIEGFSFSTSNLISNIDFEKRQGTFKSQAGGSRVDFTDNRYVSYINEFSWEMDKNSIYMGTRGSKGNRFISTHRKQDSLSFYVPIAMYDVHNKTIYAEDVKNIEAGDANLFLKDGVVTIRENAVIDPLDSVQIIVKTGSLIQHTLYDAHVNISGKNEYNGYGKYDYINGDGKKLTLDMHNIEYGKEEQTIAETNITNSDLFTFNSHFAYKGKAKLSAKEQFLYFDGGAQMLHSCPKGPQTYVRFEATIDPSDVRIPIGEEIQNFEYKDLYKDFFITKDSSHVYSSFLAHRKDYSDISMLNAHGYLVYNDKNKSFDIASENKLANPDSIGTLMRFDENLCNIQGYGDLNIGIDLEQVKTKASGSIIHDKAKNKTSVSAMLGIDFFFNEQAIDELYKTILNSDSKESKLTANTYEKRMSEWCGSKLAIKTERERSIIGESRALPIDLRHTLLFSNIDFVWNSQKRAFIAEGKADLAYLKHFVVNKEVNVLAEITRKRSGNSIEVFIELTDESWVYFIYKNSEMQTLSSNSQYNEIIDKLKPEERKQKTGLGEKHFSYMMAPQSMVKRFKDKFKEKSIAANGENKADNKQEVTEAVD